MTRRELFSTPLALFGLSGAAASVDCVAPAVSVGPVVVTVHAIDLESPEGSGAKLGAIIGRKIQDAFDDIDGHPPAA